MKITNCYIERTFNLGNFESLKVGFDAALNESDRPLEVTADLEMLCHQHFENRSKPKPVQPTPQPKPQTPPAPSDQEEDLEYINNAGVLIIKPKKYLSTERWNEVNKKVKVDGGKWVKNDKDSHWEVP